MFAYIDQCGTMRRGAISSGEFNPSGPFGQSHNAKLGQKERVRLRGGVALEDDEMDFHPPLEGHTSWSVHRDEL